jgi:lipopolysaccharide/colanic/teichoic acid biosynthesis glycosyltransferase
MTTPNLAIQHVEPSPSAAVHASPLTSSRFVRAWTPKIQLLADFLTIVFAFWTAAWLFPLSNIARGLPGAQHLAIGTTVAALGVPLIFRCTGMHEQAGTPLNISKTETLLRGAGFSFLLLLVAGRYVGFAGVSAALCGVSVLVLLLLQRYAGRLVEGSLQYGLQRIFAGGGNDLQPVGEIISGSQDKYNSLKQECERLNLGLSPCFESGALPVSRSHYDFIGIPPIADQRTAASGRARGFIKRLIDLALCIPGLVLSLPVFLVTSVAIKLDSDGPVFFRQKRIGKNGRVFRLWKFRSMRRDAPRYERSPLSDEDSRLTRVGRFIRRFSIDELPQLINVLCGEMSLVGPRPEMPFIVDQYGPFERRRLLVPPGITGLWQISPARALPIHQNMIYDLYYIHRQNMFLDFAILLRTVTAVVGGIGTA